MIDAPRNLRSGERFLIAPPLPALFGTERVTICDMSSKGARLRHSTTLESGRKEQLKVLIDGRTAPVVMEAVIIWSQAESAGTTGFISGARLYGDPEMMESLLNDLYNSNRSSRIEELRAIDRFLIMPALKGTFSGRPIYIEDLSSNGARIETLREIAPGTNGKLIFGVTGWDDVFTASGKVVWSSLKSITGQFTTYRSGLAIANQADMMRFAIGLLSESGNAVLDTQSLRLKLKVLRARARLLARTYPGTEAIGMSAEQFLLIEGVRTELRLNPEEAFHWYRRARLSISDPNTRAITPPISDHPDALAVWEYLDRSVDPSIIGRAFELPTA